MLVLFGVIGVVLVLVIALVAVGREVGILRVTARPAAFELEEAVEAIADDLPPEVQAEISHDDVRWILGHDVDLLEESTSGDAAGIQVVDEDAAVARVLAAAEAEGRDVSDRAIVAVLDARLRYLTQIGAVGPAAPGPLDPDLAPPDLQDLPPDATA